MPETSAVDSKTHAAFPLASAKPQTSGLWVTVLSFPSVPPNSGRVVGRVKTGEDNWWQPPPHPTCWHLLGLRKHGFMVQSPPPSLVPTSHAHCHACGTSYFPSALNSEEGNWALGLNHPPAAPLLNVIKKFSCINSTCRFNLSSSRTRGRSILNTCCLWLSIRHQPKLQSQSVY